MLQNGRLGLLQYRKTVKYSCENLTFDFSHPIIEIFQVFGWNFSDISSHLPLLVADIRGIISFFTVKIIRFDGCCGNKCWVSSHFSRRYAYFSREYSKNSTILTPISRVGVNNRHNHPFRGGDCSFLAH